MPLVIDDDVLRAASLDEREARVEIACRLFEIGRLPLPLAARFAKLGRLEFETELGRRGIAAYRPTLEDLREDLATLEHLRDGR